jgi:hypothetical protein
MRRLHYPSWQLRASSLTVAEIGRYLPATRDSAPFLLCARPLNSSNRRIFVPYRTLSLVPNVL